MAFGPTASETDRTHTTSYSRPSFASVTPNAIRILSRIALSNDALPRQAEQDFSN